MLSKTIGQEATSRNRCHFSAFEQIKELLGDRPLVLDREFSYVKLLKNLVEKRVNFVIRLKIGPNFLDDEAKSVFLSVWKGETRIFNKIYYKGKVRVNVIGVWQQGFSEPMWVMTNLDPKAGLVIYEDRMKIEETFRDLKSLLNFQKLMNKHRSLMEKMVALILIAYSIIPILGEVLRSQTFPHGSRKRMLYSGPFLSLKLKLSIPPSVFSVALSTFLNLVLAVRSNV